MSGSWTDRTLLVGLREASLRVPRRRNGEGRGLEGGIKIGLGRTERGGGGGEKREKDKEWEGKTGEALERGIECGSSIRVDMDMGQ